MQFNEELLNQYLDKFKAYIEHKASNHWVSSTGLKTNDFFMSKKQEGYKDIVYQEAQKSLDLNSWENATLGNGVIKERAKIAINKAQNLVFANQKTHFKNKCNENTIQAEKILYNIYFSNEDAKSFDEAVRFWGGKYDLIAYLFFIKDKEKYLPICPGHFDKIFEKLGIDLRMSYKCSNANYWAFINCIDELRKHMEHHFDFNVSLLEAHSVIWMINSVEEFINQAEEQKADALLAEQVNNYVCENNFVVSEYTLTPSPRENPTSYNGCEVYPRKKSAALNALYKANHCCEFNQEHESFIRKNSNIKYMEPHHLVPMSQSKNFDNSLDKPENIICLCSNCHNEIHYGKNSKILISRFYNERKNLLKKIGIEITEEELLEMY